MRARGKFVLAAVGGVAVAGTAFVVACGDRTGLDALVGSSSANVEDAGDAARQVQPVVCRNAGVQYIYVVSEENELYSYYPPTAEFTDVGTINCPAPAGDTPFSMAVDRQGNAYVVFQQGDLFHVSMKTAACEATPFVPNQHGFVNFGMGFVANQGDAGETLFVVPDTMRGQPSVLATIDLTSFKLNEVASFANPAISAAELTGTGDGKLYGFFVQDTMAPPSFIVQIDPQNADILEQFTLNGDIQGTAWAFGFWGGNFYRFTAPDGVTSVVTEYSPSTGTTTQVATAPQGVLLVGAGVSTCAPTR
jgi:hypothetical protein